MPEKNSYCSYCGHPFRPDQPWPRQCAACGEFSFLNPLPVAVVLLPVDDGLLVVRRSIEPQKGELALPGGFITQGETWQQAGARELFEETGIAIEPQDIGEFRALSNPGGTILIVFGLAPKQSAAALPPFAPNDEATERLVLNSPEELAFPLHTQAAREFFESQQMRPAQRTASRRTP